MPETRPVFMSRPGTRVYLSPVEKGDLPFFAKVMNNEEISLFLQGHHPTTIEDEEEWFKKVSKRQENDRIFVIVLKETNEAIGVLGLHSINWIDRTAGTGAFIGREDLLGKGLGTEAKMLVLKYAFHELNLKMIVSRAYAFNGRSIRYSEKCGYKQIAVYPDWIFRDGKYHDLIHLMVTREMWEPLWKEFEERMKGDKSEQ
jgi:RimJ/RimL family protein N-acetyltransferase